MNVKIASVMLLVLSMTACSELSPTSPAGSALKTYNSVWIDAVWTGAGAPHTTQYGPSSFTGSYCPVNSLILENHTSRYQSVFSNSLSSLVFKNTCSGSADLLVCQSGGAPSEFPRCNADIPTTPLSRLASVSMGPNGSGLQSTTWRTTGLDLELDIFYCGLGDAFTLGVIPGGSPTDCLQH